MDAYERGMEDWLEKVASESGFWQVRRMSPGGSDSRERAGKWEVQAKEVRLELTPMGDNVLQQSSIVGDDES